MEFLNSNFTYNVPVTEGKPGETQIYRNAQYKNELLSTPSQGDQTVQDTFLRIVKKQPDSNFLGSRVPGTKEFRYKTYGEVKELSTYIGSGIINMGLAPNVQEYDDLKINTVGIYAKNRVEWSLVNLANVLYGFTTIGLNNILGPDATWFIIKQAEIVTCFCEQQNINSLLKSEDLGILKNIVCLDEIQEETQNLALQKSIHLFSLQDVIESGKKHQQNYAKINSQDIYSINYTSGTTGTPKGVMVPHRSYVSPIQGISNLNFFQQSDTYLSFLPMGRGFEAFCLHNLMSVGASICFFSGDMKNLKQDVLDVKPTIYISFPRMYNKLYFELKKQLASSTDQQKKILIDQAVSEKTQKLEDTGDFLDEKWDSVIFKEFQQMIGGRVRLMISGGAPLSQEVQNLIKIVMCCPLVNTYGSTEITGSCFNSNINDNVSGHVGSILPELEFKLIDIPEMNYTSKDINSQGNSMPRGELLVRGSIIFYGYFKNIEKTKEALDKQGWFHTGDIATILPNGAAKIIDRRGNMYKLSTAQYIAPEKIEHIYARTSIVEEIFVCGESIQDYNIVIVFPNQQTFMAEAQKRQLNLNFEELCQNIEMKQFVLKQLQEKGKQDGLVDFEQAKKIILITKNFQQLGCVTPTMKLQRRIAQECLREQIQKVYQEGL